MDPGVQLAELLAYNAEETSRWKRWFTDHPAALDLPCDVAGAGTVRKLVRHVFMAELIFANHCVGLPRPDVDKFPAATLEDLFAISEEANGKFRESLAKLNAEGWTETIPLGFRDLKATRRKMIMQAIWHGINHRGQLATFLRQQGLTQDWIHDFILSSAME